MKEQSKIGLLLLLLKSDSIIKLEEMRETFKLNFNQVENEAGSSSSSLGTSFAAIVPWAILNKK